MVKDYFQICESYFDAVKRLPPAQIEAIDMGRRGIHNEGSRVLLERLDGQGRHRHGHRAPALHPDLRAALQGLSGPVTANPQSVLFCCDYNAVRSPMAEGIMKKNYGTRIYVQSAGVKNELEVDGFCGGGLRRDRGRAATSTGCAASTTWRSGATASAPTT